MTNHDDLIDPILRSVEAQYLKDPDVAAWSVIGAVGALLDMDRVAEARVVLAYLNSLKDTPCSNQ